MQPNGINHLALSTSDMRQTLLYFNHALGFPLQALYWMHGVKDTIHGFLKVNDNSLLAFVYNPDVSSDIQVGKTHPGSSDNVSTKGTMHHLSFSVDSLEDLRELQKSIKDKNINCSEITSDGFLSSIEFPGPDGIILNICHKMSSTEEELFELDAAQSVGISLDDINSLKSPLPYTPPALPVKNVPLGEDAGYRMNYPLAAYRTMISVSDQTLLDATRDEIPPNKKQPLFRPRVLLGKLKLASMIAYYTITGLWRKS